MRNKRLKKKDVTNMIYQALDVGHYVINCCRKNQYLISNLKLQKVLYFIQATFLIKTGNACFNDKIEAWDFGPVIPNIYIHEKLFFNRK